MGWFDRFRQDPLSIHNRETENTERERARLEKIAEKKSVRHYQRNVAVWYKSFEIFMGGIEEYEKCFNKTPSIILVNGNIRPLIIKENDEPYSDPLLCALYDKNVKGILHAQLCAEGYSKWWVGHPFCLSDKKNEGEQK